MSAEAVSLGGSPPRPAGPGPYKFLNYFEEEERELFAGREEESQEVLVGIICARTFVVYGSSGLGKTSLLLAGVFPLLRERGLHPLRVRLLDSPVEDLCAALAEEFDFPKLAPPVDPGAIPGLLATLSSRVPIVLVLDQFEEFFVRFRDQPQARAGFAALLGSIFREPSANVRLVFSLREDYFAELEDLHDELPGLTDHGFRLLPLTAYGARQAIVRPLMREGISYDEAFVNHLVDLLEGWGFDPPILQIVCSEVYRDVAARREPPVHLTREDLDRLGGVDGIFAHYVSELGRGLSRERQLLVRLVLDSLITSEQTKCAVRLSDLRQRVRAPEADIEAILQDLVTRCLVRRELRRGELWYEFIHERLVDIVQHWLSSDPDFARLRFAKTFVGLLSADTEWRTNPLLLLSVGQLAERVEPWKEWILLGAVELEFILRSSIVAGMGSVAFWAARLDEQLPGRSAEVVLDLLRQPDASARSRAADACELLHPEDARLTEACQNLALKDPSDWVRRAAGRAFARRASPLQTMKLVVSLEESLPSPAALELLAELQEHGPAIVPIAPWLRRRTAAHVRQRRLRQFQEHIQRWARKGALAGLVAGLLWSVTMGLVNAVTSQLVGEPAVVTSNWPWGALGSHFTTFSLLVCLLSPLGALIGWVVASKAARDAAKRGQVSWSRPVFRSWLLITGYLLVALYWAGDTAEYSAEGSSAGFLVWLASLVTMSLSTAGLVLLGFRCMAGRLRGASSHAWALLCATCVPWAGALFVSALVAGRHESTQALVRSAAELVALVSSFTATVCLFALQRAQGSVAIGSPPTVSRPWLARAVPVVSLAVMVLIALTVFRLDTVPVLARSLDVQDSPVLAGSHPQGWQDSDYWLLRFPDDVSPARPRARRVVDEDACRATLLVDGHRLEDGDVLVTSSPRALAAVTTSTSFVSPLPGNAWENHPDQGPRCGAYVYRLPEEPIREGDFGPEPLESRRLTVISTDEPAREERLAAGSPERPPSEEAPDRRLSWRIQVSGRLSPQQVQSGYEVMVMPALVSVPQVQQGACVTVEVIRLRDGVAVSTGQAVSLANQEERARLGRTPRGDIWVKPQKDGRWSLLLNVSIEASVSGMPPSICGASSGMESLLGKAPLTELDPKGPVSLTLAAMPGQEPATESSELF